MLLYHTRLRDDKPGTGRMISINLDHMESFYMADNGLAVVVMTTFAPNVGHPRVLEIEDKYLDMQKTLLKIGNTLEKEGP